MLQPTSFPVPPSLRSCLCLFRPFLFESAFLPVFLLCIMHLLGRVSSAFLDMLGRLPRKMPLRVLSEPLVLEHVPAVVLPLSRSAVPRLLRACGLPAFICYIAAFACVCYWSSPSRNCLLKWPAFLVRESSPAASRSAYFLLGHPTRIPLLVGCCSSALCLSIASNDVTCYLRSLRFR